MRSGFKKSKINYKIREHSLSKSFAFNSLWQKRSFSKSITIRKLGSEKQETIKFAKA